MRKQNIEVCATVLDGKSANMHYLSIKKDLASYSGQFGRSASGYVPTFAAKNTDSLPNRSSTCWGSLEKPSPVSVLEETDDRINASDPL